MNRSAGKIGIIDQRSAHANGLSTPPIGCVLHLVGLPGGGNKIYDRSPYGNIGTITGATWHKLPSGLWCLSFDGNDDYVDCGNDSSLNITGAVTVEVWLKPISIHTSNWAGIVWKGGDWAVKGYHLVQLRSIDNGIVRWAIINDAGTGTNVQSSTGATVDNWWHICGTFDGSIMRLFINGTEEGTPVAQTDIGSNPSRHLTIGKAAAGTCQNSLIVLPRIYNRALSALEIQNHFNREKHLFGVW